MSRFRTRFHRSLILLFAVFTLAGCGKEKAESSAEREVTPEEFAQEMGLDMNPSERRVPIEDFNQYPLVVDVFRRSPENPVLGAFNPGYVDLLVPAGSHTPEERVAEAERIFRDLADREFAVVSVNGSPYKAQIISGGLEARAAGGFRTTPAGNYKLDIRQFTKRIPVSGGGTRSATVDFPWLRSRTYGNSIMYWGLWMFGGYFIHSTTHYGQLGERASMGCIRQAYPDAMELFQLRQQYRGLIRVHKIGSPEAVARFHEITSHAWALPRLHQNLTRILDYVEYAGKTEIVTQGHAWIDPATGSPGTVQWPDCGPVDCFQIWDRKLPAFSAGATTGTSW